MTSSDGFVDNGRYDGCKVSFFSPLSLYDNLHWHKLDKCLITTALQDCPGELVPIRSYPCDDRADPITCADKRWKIWEAARAATAAPVYFRPLEKDGRKFIDAGSGYNNPSVEVFHEVKNKIPEFVGRPIACFVSIGTGASAPHPVIRKITSPFCHPWGSWAFFCAFLQAFFRLFHLLLLSDTYFLKPLNDFFQF